MSIKIKKINIRAFRGIPDLELTLDGKGLLLKGDNGTGKSSIVDALELFFCGKVGHLEGVQGISLQKHAPHISCKPDDIKVSITFDPGGVELERTFSSGPACPTNLKEYFRVTQTGVFILRRAQILEFIISKPADRFRAIGSIIGIGDLDDIELAMMRAQESLEESSSSKTERKQRILEQLTNILGREISSDVEALDALNGILKTARLPLIKEWADADKHAEAMLAKAKSEEAVQKIGRLEKLSVELKGVAVEKEGIINTSRIANEKIKSLLGEEARKERSIADLLTIGAKVMEGWQMDFCPLCQNEINRSDVLRAIKERLNTVKALSKKASEIRKECATVKQHLEEISRVLAAIAPKFVEFPELEEENEIFNEQVDAISKIISNVDSAGEAESEISLDALEKVLLNTQGLVSSSSKKCDSLFEAKKITEAEKEVLRIVALIGQAKSLVDELLKIALEIIAIQKQLDVAGYIYSKFTSIKKTKLQEVFDVIQSDMEKYYTQLHPGDAHRNIELRLPSTRRASIELKIESFGRKGEDPRAYGSEGHLDSLGLCIFLALVRKFNDACSLIVLDDVVTTVDVGHRENICKLLIEEFGDKQLIITTHEGLWYEQLRSHHRAAKVDGDFKYLSATKWELDSGPVIRPYKPRWERIEEKLDSGDKSVATEGRTYMEWVLESICDALEAPVTFRNSKEWNVGELLSSAKKRAESLIKEADYKEKVLTAFRELEGTTIYGNIISHNNPLAEELSIAEVGNFCRAVNNLYCAFLCPNCNNMLKYSRDFKIIRCSNPRCAKQFEVKTS